MNQIPGFSEFDIILNDAINTKFQKKMDKLLKTVLSQVDFENLSLIKQIFSENNYNIRSSLKLNTARKTRVKKDISPCTRCLARIGLGTQCSRSKMNNSAFCKSHFISLPYGRIDGPEIADKKISKKRGRRCKTNKAYDIEDLDMHLYVQSILIKINDESYLLDQNNILYKFNNLNEIVGSLVDDQVKWY